MHRTYIGLLKVSVVIDGVQLMQGEPLDSVGMSIQVFSILDLGIISGVISYLDFSSHTIGCDL